MSIKKFEYQNDLVSKIFSIKNKVYLDNKTKPTNSNNNCSGITSGEIHYTTNSSSVWSKKATASSTSLLSNNLSWPPLLSPTSTSLPPLSRSSTSSPTLADNQPGTLIWSAKDQEEKESENLYLRLEDNYRKMEILNRKMLKTLKAEERDSN